MTWKVFAGDLNKLLTKTQDDKKEAILLSTRVGFSSGLTSTGQPKIMYQLRCYLRAKLTSESYTEIGYLAENRTEI